MKKLTVILLALMLVFTFAACGGGGGGKAGAEWSSNLQMWICWGNSARGGNGTAGSDGGAGFALVLY